MSVYLAVCDVEGRAFAFFNVAVVPRVGEEIDVVAVEGSANTPDPLPVDPRPVLRVVHVPRADCVRVFVGPAPATPEETASTAATLTARAKADAASSRARPKPEGA